MFSPKCYAIASLTGQHGYYNPKRSGESVVNDPLDRALRLARFSRLGWLLYRLICRLELSVNDVVLVSDLPAWRCATH
jgi:hypothetical protein